MNCTSENSSNNETGENKEKLHNYIDALRNIAVLQNVKDENSRFAIRFFGVDLKVKAGLDLKSFTGKGNIFGYEVKATGILLNYEAGPIVVHLGAGISSAAKVEDGTVDSRFLGCGTKIGKRIGFSIFDSELSIETMFFFGKGWLWGKHK